MVAKREEESLRHHAHHRVRRAADSNRLADDVRSPAHPREPELVPDDDDVRRSDDLVGGVERAAEVRRNAEQGENRRRHLGAADRIATSVVREDVVQILAPQREIRERGELRAPLGEIVERSRDGARRRLVVVADHHDPIAAVHRERPRERVQDVERQQADRNADRQREDGDERQAGLPDEHPRRELHVEPGRARHRQLLHPCGEGVAHERGRVDASARNRCARVMRRDRRRGGERRPPARRRHPFGRTADRSAAARGSGSRPHRRRIRSAPISLPASGRRLAWCARGRRPRQSPSAPAPPAARAGRQASPPSTRAVRQDRVRARARSGSTPLREGAAARGRASGSRIQACRACVPPLPGGSRSRAAAGPRHSGGYGVRPVREGARRPWTLGRRLQPNSCVTLAITCVTSARETSRPGG